MQSTEVSLRTQFALRYVTTADVPQASCVRVYRYSIRGESVRLKSVTSTEVWIGWFEGQHVRKHTLPIL
jgi:hypothetical protein